MAPSRYLRRLQESVWVGCSRQHEKTESLILRTLRNDLCSPSYMRTPRVEFQNAMDQIGSNVLQKKAESLSLRMRWTKLCLPAYIKTIQVKI